MSPLSNMLVHVGLAQAGSSTLQLHVFNRRQFGFALLTSDRIATVRKYIEVPLAGEFEARRCAEFFYRQFAEYRSESLIPVISNEGLADDFLQMEDNFRAEVNARRLKEAFGQCKILLIVREQASHLVSKYRKNLETKRRSNVPLRSFLRDQPLVQRVQTDCDSVFLPVLKHHNLVSLYWDLFGPQNTLVLPIEMMSRQPAEFIKRLNAFCGSQIPLDCQLPQTNANGRRGLSSFYRAYNTVYSPFSISMLWFLNPRWRWRRRWKRHASFVGRTSNSLQKRMVSALRALWVMTDSRIARERDRQLAAVRSMLGDYFAESNRILSEMIGIDLAEYGYNVGHQRQVRAARNPKASLQIDVDQRSRTQFG